MRTINKVNAFEWLLLLWMAALVLFGCSNYTKKLQKATPVTSQDSGQFAKKCSDMFPVREVVKPGKTITKTVVRENTKKVDALNKRISELLSNTDKISDSLRQVITREIMANCKPKNIIQHHYTTDTIIKTDSALIFQYRQQNSILVNANTVLNDKLQTANKEASDANKRANRWQFRFWLLAAGALVAVLRKQLWALIKVLLKIA